MHMGASFGSLRGDDVVIDNVCHYLGGEEHDDKTFWLCSCHLGQKSRVKNTNYLHSAKPELSPRNYGRFFRSCYRYDLAVF